MKKIRRMNIEATCPHNRSISEAAGCPSHFAVSAKLVVFSISKVDSRPALSGILLDCYLENALVPMDLEKKKRACYIDRPSSCLS